MYAIVKTGGKQYRVEEGRTVTVDLLHVEEGERLELDNVLLIADNGNVTVGTPTIEGARVVTQVEAHGRDKKIIVFKYRAKVRTRKKTGHRQHFTRLAVTEILAPGQESKTAKPKRRRRTKKAETAAETPAAEAAIETPTGEAAPAPKRRTRKPAVAKAEAATAEKAAPKRRTRKTEAAKAKAETPTAGKAPPKRRTRKPTAAKAETATAEKAAPKRRTRRKAADENKE